MILIKNILTLSFFIANQECPVGLIHFQQSCYKVDNTKLSRDEAARACGPNGHLTDITSSEEQEFIVNLLTASGSGDAWFGLLANREEGTLTWSNGLPLVPEPWQDIVHDEPVSCLRLREDSDYKWRDYECSEPFRFICEFKGISCLILLRNKVAKIYMCLMMKLRTTSLFEKFEK